MAFAFFYDIAKRVKGTKRFIEDPAVAQEYQRLVDKRMPESTSIAKPNVGPSPTKKVAVPFSKKKIPIPKYIAKNPTEFEKYVKNKIKELNGKLAYSGNVMEAFDDVSNGIINLYHYIYKYAPE